MTTFKEQNFQRANENQEASGKELTNCTFCSATFLRNRRKRKKDLTARRGKNRHKKLCVQQVQTQGCLNAVQAGVQNGLQQPGGSSEVLKN